MWTRRQAFWGTDLSAGETQDEKGAERALKEVHVEERLDFRGSCESRKPSVPAIEGGGAARKRELTGKGHVKLCSV